MHENNNDNLSKFTVLAVRTRGYLAYLLYLCYTYTYSIPIYLLYLSQCETEICKLC